MSSFTRTASNEPRATLDGAPESATGAAIADELAPQIAELQAGGISLVFGAKPWFPPTVFGLLHPTTG
jgi:hypothetical protein